MGVACSLVPGRGLRMRLRGIQVLFCLSHCCLLQLASVSKAMPTLKVFLCIQQHSPRMLSIDALAASAWKLGFTCQKFSLITDGWKFAQFARLKPHEKFALYRYSILSPNEPCISRPLWFSACKCVTKCVAVWLSQECLWHQCSYLFRLVLYTCMHINILYIQYTAIDKGILVSHCLPDYLLIIS